MPTLGESALTATQPQESPLTPSGGGGGGGGYGQYGSGRRLSMRGMRSLATPLNDRTGSSSRGRPPPVAAGGGATSGRMEYSPTGTRSESPRPRTESPSRGASPRPSASPRDGASVATRGGEKNNVQVMVRVRPFADAEIKHATKTRTYMQSVIDMPRSDQCVLLDHDRDYETKQAFSFDNVFWSVPEHQQKSPVGFASQALVYSYTGAVALQSAWEGFNSCVFAYGQTGSGKTHTMMGDPARIAQGTLPEAELGVIPRLCKQLFVDIQERKQNALKAGIQKEFRVHVSFTEIYNEKVKDLLSGAAVCPSFVSTIRGGAGSPPGDSERKTRKARDAPASPKTPVTPRDRELRFGPGIQPHARSSGAAADFTATTHPQRDPLDIAPKPEPDLKVREHPTEGPIIDGVTIHEPADYMDMMELITHGSKERATAHTKMNDRSSRSHAVFRIALRQVSYFDRQRVGITGPGQQSSERRANINLVDLAGSENVKRSGAAGSTMVEAQKINVSLTTLRRVIDALIDKKPRSVVPYRDSTLTWLLRTDLGGNSKCIMLATVSPHYLNSLESFRTLQYAMRARSIVNSVRVNEDDTAAMLDELEKRMRDAQSELDKQGISSEHRDRLMEELAAAASAREEMQARLSDMQRRAAECQELLEKERKKRAMERLRGCAVMDLIHHRRLELAGRHSATVAEVDQMKAKLRETGHEDVESLAAALRHNKERETQLQLERQRLHQHVEEQRRLADERLQVLEQEGRALHGQERLRSEEAQRALRQMQEQRGRMRRELDQLEEAQAAEKSALAADNRKVLEALMHEMEAAATQFERDQEQYHREAAELEEQCRRTVRKTEHSADARMRVLQEQEERLRQELAAGRADAQQIQARIDTLQGELGRQRQEVDADCDREMAQVRKDGAERIAAEKRAVQKLSERLAVAEKEAEQRLLQKTAVQDRFQNVAEREQVYRRAFDEICAFFDYIGTDKVPAHWTMQDFRKTIDDFRRYQRAYSSHRPSKEQLRQMLREDPSRSGAETMRAMLTQATEEHAAPAQCNVLLDGLRCPDLPAHYRSARTPRDVGSARAASDAPGPAATPGTVPAAAFRSASAALPERRFYRSCTPRSTSRRSAGGSPPARRPAPGAPPPPPPPPPQPARAAPAQHRAGTSPTRRGISPVRPQRGAQAAPAAARLPRQRIVTASAPDLRMSLGQKQKRAPPSAAPHRNLRESAARPALAQRRRGPA